MPKQIPLVTGFYRDGNRHWSRQDCLNMLPVPAEKSGTLTPMQLRQVHGCKPYVQIGTAAAGEGGSVFAAAGINRGLHNAEGKLFAVAGNKLWQITNSGVTIPLGTIPGAGRVSMAHNANGLGNELLTVNGSAGYVYNTQTLAFGKVTDTGYPGAFVADFVDQYLAQVEPGGRYWFHSDLADANSYNTLDRYEAEGDPDRIVSLLVSHREVLVFGKDTIEPYVNAGGSTGTFQRASNTVIEVGCSARFTPRRMDGSPFWLDDQRLIRRLNGYTPAILSTDPVAEAFAECSEAEISQAYAFTWEPSGHKIYYVTVPGRFTFGYDAKTGEFHRRATFGLPHWAIADIAYWNGQWIAADSRNSNLYTLDPAYALDGCEQIERKVTAPVLWAEQNEITVNSVEVMADATGPITECASYPMQPEGPTISGAAPDGNVGEPWGPFSYSVTGGTPPYVFSARPGNQPIPGIPPLSVAGELPAGAPTTAGTFTQVVRVTDASGLWDQLADPVHIGGAPVDWLMLTSTVNGLLYSHGGGDWTGPMQPRPDGVVWKIVGWGDGELLMSDRLQEVAWSNNKGTSWTTSTLPVTVSGNKGYLARINGYWWIPSGTLTEVQRGDGVTFIQPGTGTAACGESIAAIGDGPVKKLFMVASGQPKASKSLDNGATWAFTGGNMRSGGGTATRVGIASDGEGRLVIAGAFGGGGFAYIAYSDDDGETWVSVSVPFVGVGAITPTYVTYRNGLFLIGNKAGEIAYSADGATFLLAGATGSTKSCQGIDHDGERYIAIFNDDPVDGYMAESVDDLVSWQQIVPTSAGDQQHSIVAMDP